MKRHSFVVGRSLLVLAGAMVFVLAASASAQADGGPSPQATSDAVRLSDLAARIGEIYADPLLAQAASLDQALGTGSPSVAASHTVEAFLTRSAR